jgi:hypothetical protein
LGYDSGNAVIDAGPGDDTIEGNLAVQVIDGAAGVDTLDYASS